MGVVAPFARFAALQLLILAAWSGVHGRPGGFDVLDYVDPLIGTAAGGMLILGW
jgi:hypothetical protein